MNAEFVRAYPDGRIAWWDGGAPGLGKRHFKRFANHADATAEAARMRAELARGAVLKVGPGATWNDLCQAWVDAHDGQSAEGTFRRRLTAINKWIVPTVGTTLVRDTRLSTLVAPLDALVGAGCGRSSLDTVAMTMSVIAAWGRERDWLPSDPFGSDGDRRTAMRALRKKVEAVGQRRAESDGDDERGITLERVPTWDEVCAFATAVGDRSGGRARSRDMGDLYAAAVRLAAGSGVRLCELLALAVESVTDDGMLEIDWQLDRYTVWPEGESMRRVRPKRGKRRKTALWERVRPDVELLMAAAKTRGDGLLVPRMAGVRWWADGWGRLLESAREDIAWKWPPHYLRHHFGSYSLAPRDAGGLGREGAEVQAWLGHTKLSTTLDTYVQRTKPSAGWLA